MSLRRSKPLRADPAKQRAWEQRSRGGLDRGAELQRTGGPKRTASKPRRRAVSPASAAQRAKVAQHLSIISARVGCDPMHVVPRSLGGCDDPLCVVPATREEHEAYDAGELDLLPHLIGTHVPELQHALGHVQGSLTRLLHIVTGKRHVPEGEES